MVVMIMMMIKMHKSDSYSYPSVLGSCNGPM
jgi:hypothetical protein